MRSITVSVVWKLIGLRHPFPHLTQPKPSAVFVISSTIVVENELPSPNQLNRDTPTSNAYISKSTLNVLKHQIIVWSFKKYFFIQKHFLYFFGTTTIIVQHFITVYISLDYLFHFLMCIKNNCVFNTNYTPI